jgi:trehalose synthase
MNTTSRDSRGLAAVIGSERARMLAETAERTRKALAGRRIVNVNTSASGGGAAEMLRELVPYVRGFGVDCRWLVLEGDTDFFTVTKRVHNRLYGQVGDGRPLDAAARRDYERVHAHAADAARALIRPGYVVVVHDPQPLGLTGVLRDIGSRIVWRCHVGTDTGNAYTDEAWAFLRPYLQEADAWVFHRAVFAPGWLDPARVFVIPPSIDPLATKNRLISDAEARQVVAQYGLRQGPVGDAVFVRRDGSSAPLRRAADVLQSGPAAPADAPLIVQISRWDPMKDMVGVLRGFADHLDRFGDAHLALVGPAVAGTADDPTGAEVLLACMAEWRRLPYQARARVHLACLPLADQEENAYVVNALQRTADIVVQKSLAEGFGLTVAEAMWKSRPVVGSAVGGIAEQLGGGAGILVPPNDLDGFTGALAQLVAAPARRAALGAAAHARVRSRFLPDQHMLRYAELVVGLVDG